MEAMYRTDGVLPGETPESILAGIRKLSGQLALQDFRSDVEQQQVSQQAQSAGTGGPGWDGDVARFFGGPESGESLSLSVQRRWRRRQTPPQREQEEEVLVLEGLPKAVRHRVIRLPPDEPRGPLSLAAIPFDRKEGCRLCGLPDEPRGPLALGPPCETTDEDRLRAECWGLWDAGQILPRECVSFRSQLQDYQSFDDALWDRTCKGDRVVEHNPQFPCRFSCELPCPSYSKARANEWQAEQDAGHLQAGTYYATREDALYGRSCPEGQVVHFHPQYPCDYSCIGDGIGCEPYVLPWDNGDRRCTAQRYTDVSGDGESGMLVPVPYTGAELEELCGLPCKNRHQRFPTDQEIESDAPAVDIQTNNVSNAAEWEALTECAYALLQENLDLVDFVTCITYGDATSGNCVKKQLTTNIPTIKLDEKTGKESPASSNALSHSIKIHTASSTCQQWLNVWMNGDQACACARMAGLIYHESLHQCLRGPDKFGGCQHEDMAESSFLWMLTERYSELGDGGCCSRWSLPGQWRNGNGILSMPESDCLS